MVTDNVNGQKNGNGTTPEAPDEGINIRLPELFMMMTPDGEYKGKPSEGKIGLKFGNDWQWISYTSMRKMIKLCTENKELFNDQLQKEIAKLQVESL
jgi:hypothetical protein